MYDWHSHVQIHNSSLYLLLTPENVLGAGLNSHGGSGYTVRVSVCSLMLMLAIIKQCVLCYVYSNTFVVLGMWKGDILRTLVDPEASARN